MCVFIANYFIVLAIKMHHTTECTTKINVLDVLVTVLEICNYRKINFNALSKVINLLFLLKWVYFVVLTDYCRFLVTDKQCAWLCRALEYRLKILRVSNNGAHVKYWLNFTSFGKFFSCTYWPFSWIIPRFYILPSTGLKTRNIFPSKLNYCMYPKLHYKQKNGQPTTWAIDS